MAGRSGRYKLAAKWHRFASLGRLTVVCVFSGVVSVYVWGFLCNIVASLMLRSSLDLLERFNIFSILELCLEMFRVKMSQVSQVFCF